MTHNTGAIRNIKAFVKSYLGSDSGKAALARQSIRVKNPDGSFTNQWRSAAMAHAFQQAQA